MTRSGCIAGLLAIRCTTWTADPQRPPRATLHLQQAWVPVPWTTTREDPSPTQTFQARVALPAAWRGSTARLVLEGLSYTARLSADGAPVAALTGGIGPVEAEVDAWLDGRLHTWTLDVTGAADGEELLAGTWAKRARLSSPPRVELGGGPLDKLWVSLREDGLYVEVLADGGATVRFVAALDGQVVSELGRAPVRNGRAQLNGTEWTGARWPDGPDDLLWFWAVLEDGNGRELDRLATRTGVRQLALTDRGLTVNGGAVRLVAARHWTHQLGETLDRIAAHGGNTLELHGLSPDTAWLDQADELGLYVVDLPRCDGQVRATTDRIARWIDVLDDQSQARISAMHGHPSLLVWSMEGAVNHQRPLLHAFSSDPIARVVAGLDLPSESLTAGAPVEPPAPVWWNNEVNNGDRTAGSGAHNALQTAREALVRGAIGTHIPHYRVSGPERRHWEALWRQELGSVGVKTIGDGRRASARLLVSGLTPGQAAWVGAPWLPIQGAIADGAGRAIFTVWHAGEVDVWSGDWRETTTVTPGQWRVSAQGGIRWTGSTAEASRSASRTP